MADNDDSLQDFKSDPSQLIERGEQGDTFSLQFDVGVSFHWTVEVPFEKYNGLVFPNLPK